MRRAIVTLGLLVLLAASPSQGQELGSFDGAFCGEPLELCNAGSGYLNVVGWALASTGVRRVVIQVDGENLGQASYGLPRADVTALFPGFPDSARPGWAYSLNSTFYDNGLHRVSARVETFGGSTYTLHGPDLLFTNNQSLLEPFGEIESPGHNEDVFGTCERAFCGDGVCEPGMRENCLNCPIDCNSQELGLFDDFCCGDGAGPGAVDCDDARCSAGGFACSDDRRIRYAVVRGWALDLGLTQEDTGVSWVELYTNGASQPVGSTQSVCTFDPLAGGLTNCFGLPRLDLEARFPFAFNAPSAGYRFVLDVGGLILSNLARRGNNVLTVRAGDVSNQFEDVDDVPVNFLCAEEHSEDAFGRIESPREGRVYSGLLTFQGWALDGEGIDAINVYVDGGFVGEAEFGDPALGTRPVVAAEYPGYEDSEAPVWRLEDYNTTVLVDGEHQVQVEAVDDEGDTIFIGGEITFLTDN